MLAMLPPLGHGHGGRRCQGHEPPSVFAHCPLVVHALVQGDNDMPSSFGRQVMLPILLGIGAAHPDLHYTLSFNDHLIDPAQEGTDPTIRFGGLERSGGLVARKLGRQRRRASLGLSVAEGSGCGGATS